MASRNSTARLQSHFLAGRNLWPKLLLSKQPLYISVCRFSHISTMTLTATSVERFFSLFFPIRARGLCTVKNSRRVMAVVVLFFSIFDALWFKMVEYNAQENDCQISLEEQNMYRIYKYVDATFYSYLPIGLMVCSNTAIVTKVLMSRYSTSQSNLNNSALSKAANSVTLMLVGTCSLFIIFTLPYAIIYSADSNMSTYTYATILILLYSNHAFNFVVYILGNSQFRKEFVRLFLGKRLTQVTPFTESTATLNLSRRAN